MNLPTFLLILCGVLLNAGAQLLLKAGVTPLGALSVDLHNVLPTTLRVLSQWPILAGLACYVVSVGVWIVGLSRVDVGSREGNELGCGHEEPRGFSCARSPARHPG